MGAPLPKSPNGDLPALFKRGDLPGNPDIFFIEKTALKMWNLKKWDI